MIVATVWWYLARASGMVAAALLVLSFLWGVFLSTKILQDSKRPAWLLDLHRWLGGLTVGFVAVHLLALVADSYVEFDLSSILVPFASQWRPTAVTWGVVSLYILVAVQMSSWLRPRLTRRIWHGIHLLSFPLVWLVAMHAGGAGSDTSSRVYQIVSLSLIIATVAAIVYRIVAGTGRPGSATSARSSRSQAGRRAPARR